MQNLKSVTVTTLVTLGVFIVTAFVACKKKDIEYNDTTNIRPCENIICLNGGTCNDGVCYCAAGFEGKNCAQRWSDRFVGNYKATDECYTGSSEYYFVNILPFPNYASKINIQNLGTACPGQILEASINPERTSFKIPMQQICGNNYIGGEGSINGDYINIYLEQRDTILHTSNNCSIVLDKQ